MQTPHYINSTSSTIAIGWQAPSNLGGCPVLGYQIFTSDGLSNAVNIPVPAFNSLNPNLNSFVIEMSLSGVVGLIYKIRIQASNYEGIVSSDSVSIALASLPSQPSVLPVSDPAITNES